MNKKQIILGGTGGQGIILSGIILAQAAVNDRKYVVQSQNYGPESRGGASMADVIISDSEIFYPKVQCADIFLALSQEAFERYKGYTSENTIVILDSGITGDRHINYSRFGILDYAYNVIKKPLTVNMISLGLINKLTALTSYSSMKIAIEKNVPKGTLDINLSAYNAGYNILKNQ